MCYFRRSKSDRAKELEQSYRGPGSKKGTPRPRKTGLARPVSTGATRLISHLRPLLVESRNRPHAREQCKPAGHVILKWAWYRRTAPNHQESEPNRRARRHRTIHLPTHIQNRSPRIGFRVENFVRDPEIFPEGQSRRRRSRLDDPLFGGKGQVRTAHLGNSPEA